MVKCVIRDLRPHSSFLQQNQYVDVARHLTRFRLKKHFLAHAQKSNRHFSCISNESFRHSDSEKRIFHHEENTASSRQTRRKQLPDLDKTVEPNSDVNAKAAN